MDAVISLSSSVFFISIQMLECVHQGAHGDFHVSQDLLECGDTRLVSLLVHLTLEVVGEFDDGVAAVHYIVDHRIKYNAGFTRRNPLP